MLLFIGIQNGRKTQKLCFNTSYVTVYLGVCVKVFSIFLVSIHLMLLFIINPKELKDINFLFQYISCYCLSNAFPSLLFLSYHTSPYFTRLFSFFTSRNPTFSYSITFLYFQGFYIFFYFSAGNFIL